VVLCPHDRDCRYHEPFAAATAAPGRAPAVPVVLRQSRGPASSPGLRGRAVARPRQLALRHPGRATDMRPLGRRAVRRTPALRAGLASQARGSPRCQETRAAACQACPSDNRMTGTGSPAKGPRILARRSAGPPKAATRPGSRRAGRTITSLLRAARKVLGCQRLRITGRPRLIMLVCSLLARLPRYRPSATGTSRQRSEMKSAQTGTIWQREH
jgi:hypothetical protein